MTFEITLLAGWGDMDANGHMANTAYLNKAGDVRTKFLTSKGYSRSEYLRRGISPIGLKDEIEYFREFRLHEEIDINMLLAGLSDDGRRSIWVNEFHRGDQLAARVTTRVGWLDLKERKLVAPPDDLLAAIRQMPQADGFVTLPTPTR